jgi:hypothetical protein
MQSSYHQSMRGRARRKWTALAALLVGGALVPLGCQSPTQLELRVLTDSDCGTLTSIAISVAPTAVEAERASTKTVTHGCSAGRIGRIFVVPGGDKDEGVAIRVVAGLGVPAESCVPGNDGHCIVARRQLRFLPHATLVVPVKLRKPCEGVSCTETTTCASEGTCRSSDVACDGGGTCRLDTDDDIPGPSEAGLPSMGGDAAPDGPSEAAAGDSGTSPDGGSDSGANGAGIVRCPTLTGVQNCYLPDQICCRDSGVSGETGNCMTRGDCGAIGGYILECDQWLDCQGGLSCCKGSNTQYCDGMCPGSVVCVDSSDCPLPNATCGPPMNFFKTCI